MQPATNVIQLSDYIPRKPADRVTHRYRCILCDWECMSIRVNFALYCDHPDCGAEMRPVEAK